MRIDRLLVIILFCTLAMTQAGALAQHTKLDNWQVSIDGGKSFQPIVVPGTIEDQIQIDFDGVSIYQTSLPHQALGIKQRLLLRFAAVATHAKVFIDDVFVTEHLGGWTPFTVEITQCMRKAKDDKPLVLKVLVDEKVGHNTQGFLPIVTNHFGGIWQPVEMIRTNESFVFSDAISIVPNLENNTISLKVPVSQKKGETNHFRLSVGTFPKEKVHGVSTTEAVGDLIPAPSTSHVLGQNSAEFEEVEWSGTIESPIPLQKWSPESPTRHLLRIEMYRNKSSVFPTDSARIVFAARDFAASENSFLLNGQPIGIRGVLNWGYAPPSVAPSLDEKCMRQEIQFAKDRGFNLMKFCLWIPPKRYLELCDEMGMLAWIEYPTWHPQLDQKHLEELRREYAEFFEFDRNHASVVLRSLTCETGPSADLEVIRSLYEQCKSAIPGAVVEDDSSWISWNRIHDFYDDHPYGNNHTWVATLDTLKKYIAERTPKPLALGEAIAADTWTTPTNKNLLENEKSLAHGPWAVADNQRWQKMMVKLAKERGRAFDSDFLQPQSTHYGMLMRKFQIETYHREVPLGAYVVSVIRDFPKASMGLIDYENNPKHSPADWEFHGSSMILLQTENDRRSFDSGSKVPVKLFLTGYASGFAEGFEVTAPKLRLQLIDSNKQVVFEADSGGVAADSMWQFQPDIQLPEVDSPQRFLLQVNLESPRTSDVKNSWPLWVFPIVEKKRSVNVHSSAESLLENLSLEKSNSSGTKPDIFLTRKFDSDVLKLLKNGGRVLMIPDGSEGSFPTQDHWFLRGSVVTLPGKQDEWHFPFHVSINQKVNEQNMFVELQHFDLAGPVVPNIESILPLTDPMVLLWDSHDMREVKTHGLAFRMDVGDGRLLVTTLNHSGSTNSVGRWLLDKWIAQIENELPEPLPADVRASALARLESELNRQILPLHDSDWQFQPDPTEQGVAGRWFAPELDDSEWSKIRVDRHWEGQGHKALDHWAWYRRTVTIPNDWKSPTTYLNFTGIDDYADIYVNGDKIGSVGDIGKKETAFEARLSLDVSRWVAPGKPLQVTVAVYDWFGAGGIFRPVTLSTEPLSANPPILK
jgi:Glycosyl hydrolases family 2, sugar binding domain/Glycosyl hydrolases family 2, TIM barrel domain